MAQEGQQRQAEGAMRGTVILSSSTPVTPSMPPPSMPPHSIHGAGAAEAFSAVPPASSHSSREDLLND